MHLAITTIPPEQVTAKLAPARIQYHDLHIDPSTKSSFTTECDLASAQASLSQPFHYKLMYTLTHYHVLGSYQQLEDQVSLAEDTLFQTSVQMPANLVEGDYAAQFFLVRDREVISSADTTIVVEKTGIERWLYNLSRDRPLLYGLASVAAALAAGWLAAEAFHLARR